MDKKEINFEAAVGSEFPTKVIPLINNAKKSIRIIVFDWRWYPNDIGCACQLFNQSIIRARKRNIPISVMTNIQDVVKTLQASKINAKKPQSKRLLHSKMMIIDDEILILGSHNYSQSAFTMNQEMSVIIHAKGQLDRYISYFNKVWLS